MPGEEGEDADQLAEGAARRAQLHEGVEDLTWLGVGVGVRVKVRVRFRSRVRARVGFGVSVEDLAGGGGVGGVGRYGAEDDSVP